MPRRLIFKDNTISGYQNPDPGYTYVGYNGEVFSERLDDGQINPIGGSGSGSGLNSASNGLSVLGDSVQIGGFLNQNTTIDAAGFDFSLGSANSITLTASYVYDQEVQSFLKVNFFGADLYSGNSSTYSLVSVTNGDLQIASFDNTNTSRLSIALNSNSTGDGSNDNHMIVEDSIGNKGIVYLDDYSANFTTYSLVTKGYVDTRIIKDVTWSDLNTLVTNSQLFTGQQYRLTDFRTRHFIFSNSDFNESGLTYGVNEAPIETLILTANSNNTLDKRARSESYPQDEIWYELVDPTSTGGDKGRIYYRKDTERNVELWLDWRNVITRRFASLEFTVDDVTGFLPGETIYDSVFKQAVIVEIGGSTFITKKQTGPMSGVLTGAISGSTCSLLSTDYIYDNGYGFFGSTFNGTDELRFYGDLNSYFLNELVIGRRVKTNGGNVYIIGSYVGYNSIGDLNGAYHEFQLTSNAIISEDNVQILISFQDNEYDNGSDGVNFITIKDFSENVSIAQYNPTGTTLCHLQCNVFSGLRDVKIDRNSINTTSNFLIEDVKIGEGSNFLYSSGSSFQESEFSSLGSIFHKCDVKSNKVYRFTNGCVFLSNFTNNNVTDFLNNVIFTSPFTYNQITGWMDNVCFQGDASNNTINGFLFGVTKTLIIPDGFNKNRINGGWQSTGSLLSNTITLNGSFKNNTVNVNIGPLNANFSSATHVYATYSCDIFEASNGSKYLSYFNGSSMSYVSPTS